MPPAVLQLPDVRQTSGSSCGLAAVRSVLKYWKHASERAKLHVDERDGSHPAALQAALRAADLRVLAGEFLPADLSSSPVRAGR